MIQLPASKLDRLKRRDNPGRRCILLIAMQLNGDWYRITDADTVISYGGNDYLPGYLYPEDVDDIETTSDPKTNDISLTIQAHDKTFVGLFLSPGWMNGHITIHEQHRDFEGEILTKNVYEGLIDDFSIKEKGRVIDVNAASVWADFERVSGIKTNPVSQQRFYPTDTAFEHCAAAQKKIYWGKEAPTNRNSYIPSGGGGPGGGRFSQPQLVQK